MSSCFILGTPRAKSNAISIIGIDLATNNHGVKKFLYGLSSLVSRSS